MNTARAQDLLFVSKQQSVTGLKDCVKLTNASQCSCHLVLNKAQHCSVFESHQRRYCSNGIRWKKAICHFCQSVPIVYMACRFVSITVVNLAMYWFIARESFLCKGIHIIMNFITTKNVMCFVVIIHWLIFPYPPGLLHWHCGNLTIAPVPAKQPWWIWINTSCEFIMNDCITTTKQSTTKPCAYFLGYTI